MRRIFWIAMAAAVALALFLLVRGGDGPIFGIGDDSVMRIVYLALLLGFFGSALLGSGLRIGGIVRSLAAWALIMVALVIGYQYRYELQDVASRLTAGLVPGSPVSSIDEEGRASVAIDKLSGGHFGVRATVNGAPVFMLVDTGATTTVLTARDARAAGFEPDDLPYNVPIMTANGRATAAHAVAETLRVGDIARDGMTVLVAREGQLSESLLGMNFIGTLSAFNLRGDRMILVD